MPRLTRRYDLPLDLKASHVVFASDDTLAFTTPSADVWRVSAGPQPGRPELLVSGWRVLSPLASIRWPAALLSLARKLGLGKVEPANGYYPRLAWSSLADTVVVNSHDLVLLACSLKGDVQPRLLWECWGQYTPWLAFSSDGSRFAAMADTLLVFDTQSWSGHALDSADTCGWHPRQPQHLCVGHDGELFWADWAQGITPGIHPLGSLGVRNGLNQARGLVVLADGERFVVAFHPPRLELWQLNPPRLLEALEPADGEIYDCRLSPNGKWLVVLFEGGARVWDTRARFELTDLYPEIRDLEFAPSGDRFLTHGLPHGMNPYPQYPPSRRGQDGDLVTLWEISE